MRFTTLGWVLLTSSLSAAAGLLEGQSPRMRVDLKTSLAWWQIDPHYEHLWSTTCPADPSWQAGEGRDPGQYTDYRTRPKTIAAGRSDSRIPLFPRYRVRPLCRQAVSGEITIDDTDRLRGVRGKIVIIADSLTTGLTMRDAYERRAVLETGRYPLITFTLDSLSGVQPGDTIRATAFGELTIHGVTELVRAPVTAVRDSAGLRVRTQLSFPANALTQVFLISKVALGMGVVMKRWKTVHMGIDIVLKSDSAS
jgi:hypothetical protein